MSTSAFLCFDLWLNCEPNHKLIQSKRMVHEPDLFVSVHEPFKECVMVLEFMDIASRIMNHPKFKTNFHLSANLCPFLGTTTEKVLPLVILHLHLSISESEAHAAEALDLVYEQLNLQKK